MITSDFLVIGSGVAGLSFALRAAEHGKVIVLCKSDPLVSSSAKAQGGIASLNHYSKGACVEWLFTTMCGIRTDGENRFVVAPRPGGSFTYAHAAYRSVYGLVESAWRRADGQTTYTITVPANCTARVALPGGTEKELEAGSYTLVEADYAD